MKDMKMKMIQDFFVNIQNVVCDFGYNLTVDAIEAFQFVANAFPAIG